MKKLNERFRLSTLRDPHMLGIFSTVTGLSVVSGVLVGAHVLPAVVATFSFTP